MSHFMQNIDFCRVWDQTPFFGGTPKITQKQGVLYYILVCTPCFGPHFGVQKREKPWISEKNSKVYPTRKDCKKMEKKWVKKCHSKTNSSIQKVKIAISDKMEKKCILTLNPSSTGFSRPLKNPVFGHIWPNTV